MSHIKGTGLNGFIPHPIWKKYIAPIILTHDDIQYVISFTRDFHGRPVVLKQYSLIIVLFKVNEK